ncbi:histidine kinase [Streptomyces flaveus]|uniref:histidine kinase n=1 Tax=Streptomyces flaveus TaxID=66370 RepID=UPI0033215D61
MSSNFSRRRMLAAGAGAVLGATSATSVSAAPLGTQASAGTAADSASDTAPWGAAGRGEETRSLDELYQDAIAEGGKLVVYAGGDLANSGSGAGAREAFRQRFPEIDLTLIVDYSKYHDVRVDNQFATDTLVPDLVQLQTLHDFTRWKREGRLLSYKPAGFSKLHKQFRDPDGAWVAGMVIAFSYLYDVAAAGANAPQTPLDLVDPRWKGAIASSYPHDDDAVLYLFALYVEKYGWDWVADFAAQQPQFARGSFSPGTAVSTKQKIIGVGTGGSPTSTGPTRMGMARQQREAGRLAERARIARDLHDTLAQELAGNRMLLQAAERDWDRRPEAARKQVRAVTETLGASLADTRSIIRDLTPPALVQGDLAAALRELCARKGSGDGMPRVAFGTLGEFRSVPPDRAAELLRVAQGLLANACEHARAAHVWVTLDRRDAGAVTVEVWDNGVGFDAASPGRGASVDGRGFGLAAGRERLAAYGGTLTVDSAPGRGTRMRATLPVETPVPASTR